MDDVKKILASSNMSHKELAVFLLDYIKTHKKVAKNYITNGGLNFLLNLQLDRYYIGHSDYVIPYTIDFLKKNSKSEEDMIKYSAQLVTRLISFMIDEVCPACHQSNLYLYTNEERTNIYEVCEECLAKRLNGEWIHSREELYQADRFQIKLYMSNKNDIEAVNHDI